MKIPNIVLAICSSAICFFVAKHLIHSNVLPVEQDQVQAIVELDSVKTAVQYSPLNDMVNAEFAIRNGGNKRLIINAKELDCDCLLCTQSLCVLPGKEEVLQIPLNSQFLLYRTEINLLLVTNDVSQPSIPVCVEVIGAESLAPAGSVSVLEN